MLHPDVPARWWLVDLPHAEAAQQFLRDGLDRRRLGVIAEADIALAVLDLLAADLSDPPLDSVIAHLLYDDVVGQFRRLTDDGSMRLVRGAQHAHVAFEVATLHTIPFADALRVVLAETTRLPLLVADGELYKLLKELEPDRPGFRVVLIPEYLNALRS